AESWVTNGTVYAVRQVGDRIYVGGSFTQVGPNTGFGVALDPSTGVWAPAFPKINGTVLVAVPDGDGGFYIGGDFSRVGTRSRHNGARIVPGATPGTWDVAAWNPETDKPIRAIALAPSANTAYIGGDFAMVQGVARAGVAAVNRYTGDPILGFDPGAGTGTTTGTGSVATLTVGPVMTLAVSSDGTRLFAGGLFTSMAGTARSGLAALNAANGSLGVAFNPAPSAGGVETMTLTPSGQLLLGGGFTKVGATTRNRLAAVNAATGALDTAWAPSADGTVHALRLTADAGRVFVGGAFANIGTSARSRLALLSATGSGAVDGTWKPSADADVSALSLSADGSRLFAAGAFTKLGTTKRNYLGALATTGAGAVDAWDPNASMPAMAVAPSPTVPGGSGVSPGVVFAGGTFATVNGTARANLAAFDAATGVLVPGFVANTDKTVGVIVPSADGSSLYIGGLFKKVNGLSRSRLAKLSPATGAVDAAWAPKASAEVKALAVAGSNVYVGGAFTTINGSTRNRAAAVDATSGALSSWNPNVSNVVWALAVSPDAKTVYLGGAFSTVKGSTRKNIAAVTASTAAPTAWKPVVTAPLRHVEAVGSQVFVAVAGQSAAGGNRVVAFNAVTGGKQWEGTADGDVVALAIDGSTVYAGGHFDIITGSNVAGQNVRHHLAAFDAATGALKPWAPTVSGPHGVWALWASGGSVIAGGDFQVVAATVSAGMARFPAS
ncbi:MAG: PQQ-like beta-propeller repeat protein, partial [Actinobacteria bacterium]|nr:PQQ-like beta-propeller repeat protein [Actinomycetota bacterium]